MFESEELQALLALQEFSGIGSILGQRLVAHFGSAQAVFQAKPMELSQIQGIRPSLAKSLSGFRRWKEQESVLQEARLHGYQILPWNSPMYPQGLKQIPDAPLILFYDGALPVPQRRLVGIVGTRLATPYGIQQAKALVRAFKPTGATIVSGLAYGIDAAAHEEALQEGLPTLALVAHGLHHVYPPTHHGLAQRIRQGGGILSELVPSTPPDRAHFPMRNRLIAGMCDVVVVVESASRGGAMITAKLARDYHKEVFAVPGKTTDPMSTGCLELIARSLAGIVAKPEDLPMELGWGSVMRQEILFGPTGVLEDKIFKALKDKGALRLEDLAPLLQEEVVHLSSILTTMELDGWILRHPGGTYRLA